MFKHMNPSELEAPETEEKTSPMMKGPTAKQLFTHKTDIEQVASVGHVIFSQLCNAAKFGRFIVPVCLLGTFWVYGIAANGVGEFHPFKSAISYFSSSVSYYLGYEEAAVDTDQVIEAAVDGASGRSWLGELVYSGIGFDETKAVLLPDGQHVHARMAFLSQLPASRAGKANADDLKKLIGDYQGTLVKPSLTDEDQRIADEAAATAIEASSEWNTTAWKLRYRLVTSTLTIQKPTIFETVSAQGFWGDEASLEKMATTGTIAVTEDPGTFFAAAYIGGVPAVTMLNDYSCYTIMGVAFDGCSPLSKIDGQTLQLVRDTLYGDPAEAVVAKDVPASKEVEVTKPWYLDFPLVAGTSTLTQANFDALTTAVDLNAQGQGGSNLHTTITSPVSLLPAAPMSVSAKGLLHNPQAIEAMKMGGVVATTDVPGQFVMAAYVDGKAQIRIRTEGGICGVIFGETGSGCKEGDVSTVEAIPAIVKSLYAQPDASSAPLEPYFWFSSAPMVGDGSLNRNDIVTVFNAALNDVGNNSDTIANWTNTPKLENPPLIARPSGFFLKPENVDALSKTGAVILPEGLERTFIYAVNFNGHFSLNVIEISTRGRWDCWTVFGEVRDPIGECRAQDLTKYGDILKSMFAK